MQVLGDLRGGHGGAAQGAVVELSQQGGRELLDDVQNVGEGRLADLSDAADMFGVREHPGHDRVGDFGQLHEIGVRQTVWVLAQELLDARHLMCQVVGLASRSAVMVAAGKGPGDLAGTQEVYQHGANLADLEIKDAADLVRRQRAVRSC